MSTIAISSLPPVASGITTDVFVIVQNGVTSQITNANLFGSVTDLTVANPSSIDGAFFKGDSLGTNNYAFGNSGNLLNNATGTDNLAFGTSVLANNVSGSLNIGIGTLALINNDTGGSNLAIGYVAQQLRTSGSFNVALGDNALAKDVSSSFNTAVGAVALLNCTTGSNTAVGYRSGYLITTGTKNTILGRYTGNQGGLDIRTLSNYIVLSDGDGNPRAYWNGADATFNGALTAVGNVLVNNSSAKIGYATGAGGTVTQLTSRTTGVTINTPVGQINTFTAAGSTTATSFIVTNSSVGSSDIIVLNQSGATNLYILAVTQIIAGSFRITFYTTGGTVSDTLTINFAVIKGAIS